MSTWMILAATLGPTIAAGLGYWLGAERHYVKGYADGMTAAYDAVARRDSPPPPLPSVSRPEDER